MGKGRIEAFSDAVLAIIITIMVLELKTPARYPTLSALRPVAPVFSSYVLSFLYLGIYWSNHHHLLYATRRIGGGIMWANRICCSGCHWCRSRPGGWGRPALRRVPRCCTG